MGAAGYALAGVSLIGTAVSTAGTLEAGREAKAAADFNARMMDMEAKETLDRAEIDAADIYTRSEQAVAENERAGRMMIGEQRASLAAQGIDVNDTGTAADLQSGTVRTVTESNDRTRRDAADAIGRIKADAIMQAMGLRVNARSVRRAGAMAKRGSRYNAVGGGLAGTAQAGSMAYTAYREG